jgi:hypothetical protein
MLDIHEHNGRLALAAADLLAEFRRIVLPGRQPDTAGAAARIAHEFDGWARDLTAPITDGDVPPVLRPSAYKGFDR